MKKIVITSIALSLMLVPLMINAEPSNEFDVSSLPEYTGDINSSDCEVIYRTDKIVVVKIDGIYYFYLL